MAAVLPASAQESDRLGVTVRAGLLQMSGGGDVLRVASRHLMLDDSSFDTGQTFQADFGTDGTYGFAVAGGGIEVGVARRTSVIAVVRHI